MKKSSVILVKFGGSLITDKTGHEAVRSRVLARLSHELRLASEAFAGRIILGHGSGSFGHAAATRGGWSSPGAEPSLDVVARTQDAAGRLHRQVVKALLEAGLAPFSVLPSSLMVTSRGRLDSLAVEPLVQALESGLLPVLFGDVVLDSQNRAGILSTERVFLSVTPALLARGLEVTVAYWLGNTNGVLNSAGETIGRITRANAEAVSQALPATLAAGHANGRSPVRDVTGGMRHRVRSAWALGRLGVASWILDGRTEGLLIRAVGGEDVPGTYVDPD